jgi:hypothetical protein
MEPQKKEPINFPYQQDDIHYVAIAGLWASDGKDGGPLIEWMPGEERRLYEELTWGEERAYEMEHLGAVLVGEFVLKGVYINDSEYLDPVFAFDPKGEKSEIVEVYALTTSQLEELDENHYLNDCSRTPILAKSLNENQPDLLVWMYRSGGTDDILDICKEAVQNGTVRVFSDVDYMLIVFQGLHNTLGAKLRVDSSNQTYLHETGEYGLFIPDTDSFCITGHAMFPELSEFIGEYLDTLESR